MTPLTPLAQFGVIGICLALIGLVWVMQKSIDKNSEAMNKIALVMEGLKTVVQERLPRKG